MNITKNLGYYLVNLSYADLHQRTIANIKRLLFDYLGVALRGSRTESGEIAVKYALQNGGSAEATLIGNGTKVPAENAALANAIAAHSLELDDVDKDALFHFSPPIVSSALAAAELHSVAGHKLITAIAAGAEIMERLSRAINPSLRNRGFHTTPVCGVFGATAAAGLIFGLNETQMVNALGLAGAQACGVMEMYGESMQKRFNPGPSARNGLTAVKLVKLGYTGADNILEGQRGFCRAYSDQVQWEILMEDLGQSYEVEIDFKPYACARPIHSAIDCVWALKKQMSTENIRLSALEHIYVYRHPSWANYHQQKLPQSYHEAQTSLPYSVALALVKESNFFDDYLLAINNQEIRQLSSKVEIISDENFPTTVGSRVVVCLADKKKIAAEVKYPKGSGQNPLNFSELKNKFTKLTQSIIDEGKMCALEEVIANLEKRMAVDVINSIQPY